LNDQREAETYDGNEMKKVRVGHIARRFIENEIIN